MKTNGIVDFLLCTAALAIGSSVVVLAVVNKITPLMGVALLGAAVCCIGLSLLDVEAPFKATRKNRKRR